MPHPSRNGSPPRPAKRLKLTPPLLQKLKPEPAPYLVWDTYQRGLVLRVEPTGYRAWKVIYRHRNRPRWYHLGAANAISLADARILAAEIMLEVIRGKDPQAERKAQRTTGTFEELATRYRDEYTKKRNRSWRRADKLVRRYLLPAWGKLPANDITRADVKAVLARTNSPSLSNQILAHASPIFTWAIREGIGGIALNPCSKVAQHKTNSRERVLSDAELPVFWEAFDQDFLCGPALKVLLLTGQRPGEVIRMRHEHIKDGWWTLPGKPDPTTKWRGTKNGQSHRIWLPQAVRDIIAELGDDKIGFVFGLRDLTGAMRTICRELGAERTTPHDLRRTHGTRITGLGFGREAMNRIQNHREGGIADVYDRHDYAAEIKRIMEAVAQHILALATGSREADNVVPVKFNKQD
jgi:integrase